jgi:tRNA dimethylallyltransferase
MNKIKSYIIAGPTASGKSDFADALARRVNGVVINADSVQIYQGIENISASPLAGQVADGVQYKLFSILPLSKQISVMDYLKLAADAIEQGHPAIFVGGTGFYINGLINGISPMPDVSDENRKRAREMVKSGNLPDGFVSRDPQRTARALEVFLETGKPIEYWQSLTRVGVVVPDAIKIFINPTREILLERIAARIPKMIDGGALSEATPAAAGRAIGAASLWKYKNGELSREEAINDWITKTNQYAKRQRTWFKTQFNPDIIINRVPTDEDLENVLQK